ncbi:alpha/beta hydrolase [Ascidiimonas aurantiaca]|uniref:alpha/beta hydrolase n=1 Tax=Ascidiimonas aurantiaca TaxID=1685432 RepID=UPI0030ED4887
MNKKTSINRIVTSISLVLIFLHFSLCIAQQTTDSFIIGDKISFDSKILNEKRLAVVIPPFGYKNHPEKKYPVVYVLDAGNNLFATHGIANYYSKMLEIMPEVIIVGIVNKDRIHDFSPAPVKDYPNGGGADKFIDFLNSELTTYIDKNYPTSGYNTIVGHSIAGLLGVYVLQKKPDLFDSFLLIDPTVGWNDFQCIESTKGFFLENKTINKKVFITSCSQKQDGMYSFLGVLEMYAPESFIWEHKFYKNENHNTLGHKSICDGFEMIFKDWGNKDK